MVIRDIKIAIFITYGHTHIYTQNKRNKANWKLTKVHKNIDDFRLFFIFHFAYACILQVHYIKLELHL